MKAQGSNGTLKLAELPKPNIKILELTLIGDSPLICNRWSEKAKQQMRDKQQKRAIGPKQAKNPKAEFEASLYRHPEGGYGFPTVAFKSAAVDAAVFIDGAKKTEMRGSFHIDGELVRINGKPSMREDMVRLGGLTADIR